MTTNSRKCFCILWMIKILNTVQRQRMHAVGTVTADILPCARPLILWLPGALTHITLKELL